MPDARFYSWSMRLNSNCMLLTFMFPLVMCDDLELSAGKQPQIILLPLYFMAGMVFLRSYQQPFFLQTWHDWLPNRFDFYSKSFLIQCVGMDIIVVWFLIIVLCCFQVVLQFYLSDCWLFLYVPYCLSERSEISNAELGGSLLEHMYMWKFQRLCVTNNN